MAKARHKKRSKRSKAPARDPRRAGPPGHDGGAAPGALTWPAVRYLPSALGVGLAVFVLAGGGPDHPHFRWAVLGAALLLIGWNVLLLTAFRARGLAVNVDLRKQHYLQACAQGTVLLYWGFHLDFPFVRDQLPLIAVQLAFAYGFDMLLSWTRRSRYTLGFGPFPVIFSMNLFLWFKPEWFVFQLLMVGGGFAAKELIRWNREGRLVHIFNPSSFPLAVASLILIATGTTDATFGVLIANSQTIPPHMHLLIFLVALPGQMLFGVALMTWTAVLTTYLFGLVYYQVAGTHYFLDVYIPIPVFLGMHLLFTDPSTSPRTELGRIIFGVLYGLSTVALYQIALWTGTPTFYDKLLQVPLMNLSVRAIDRFARLPAVARLSPERLGRALAQRWRFIAFTVIWAAIFVTMNLTGGVGDRHPGMWLPHWIAKCEAGEPRACAYAAIVEQQMCAGGSPWACNEAAIAGPRSYAGLEAPMTDEQRAQMFRYACERGSRAACRNEAWFGDPAATYEHAPPTLADYPIIVQASRLEPFQASSPAALQARACEVGWREACAPAGIPPSPRP